MKITQIIVLTAIIVAGFGCSTFTPNPEPPPQPPVSPVPQSYEKKAVLHKLPDANNPDYVPDAGTGAVQ